MNKYKWEIFKYSALHPGKLSSQASGGKSPKVLSVWSGISSWKGQCDVTNCSSRVLGQMQCFLIA